jgi:hypothetical protein
MKKKHFILLLLLFLFTRTLFLDRDLPPSSETRIGQKDEQAYNFTALNLYHYGSISKPVGGQYYSWGSVKFILNNVFTFASLVVLGNNYYGLRGGAVLAALLVFLLFFRLLVLNSVDMPAAKKKFLLACAGLAMLFDFGFMIAGRNAAPMIFRCLYLMLVVTYVNHLVRLQWRRQRWHYLLLGVCCSLLIFFSYLTNAFILAGVFLFIAGKGFVERDLKKTAAALLLLLAGFLAGTILANPLYRHYGHSSVGSSVSRTFTVYSTRVSSLTPGRGGSAGSSLSNLVRSGIRKTVSLLSSNMFILNFTFLFLILLSWANTLYMMFRRTLRNHLQLLTCTLIFAYALQSFFYNPDSSKWVVLMLPVFLICIFVNAIVAHQSWSQGNFPGRMMGLTISCVLFCLISGLFAFRLLYVGLSPEFQTLVSLSFVILLTVIVVWHGKNNRAKKIILPAIVLFSFFPNAFLSGKYCLLNPEFHYRDACVQIGRIVGDKRMAGVWSDGFRLYTGGNVFFPWYQVQHSERHRIGLIDIFEKKLADYTVDFPQGDFFDAERDINSQVQSFKLRQVASYYLGWGALGKTISVFKRVDTNVSNNVKER